MKISTKYFSDISYSKDEIITFKNGLFGFEDYKNYILIRFENDSDSLICLQSIDEANIAFIMINPYNFIKDYKASLTNEDLKDVEAKSIAELLVYNVCVVQDDILKSTANLKCPIIVNPKTRNAKQVIIEDSEYPFKFPFANLISKGDDL